MKYYKLYFTEREGERERGESTLFSLNDDQDLISEVKNILKTWWGEDPEDVEIVGRWYYLCSGEIAIGKEYVKELTKKEFNILTKFSS